MRVTALLGALALCPTVIAAQASPNNSAWVGHWKLNVPASHIHAPGVKSETSEVPPNGGDTLAVKYMLTGMTGDNKPIDISFDGKADGRPYPIMSGGQQIGTAAWHRKNSHQYTVEETLPGNTKESATLDMMKSDKRFTVHSHITTPQGTFDDTSVWDRTS